MLRRGVPRHFAQVYIREARRACMNMHHGDWETQPIQASLGLQRGSPAAPLLLRWMLQDRAQRLQHSFTTGCFPTSLGPSTRGPWTPHRRGSMHWFRSSATPRSRMPGWPSSERKAALRIAVTSPIMCQTIATSFVRSPKQPEVCARE